jgi:DNA polymerase-1
MLPFQYKYVSSIDQLPNFSPDYPVFADIESDGLYINTRVIQYYQPETDPYVYILDVGYFGEHTKNASTTNALFKALGKSHVAKVTRKQIEELHKPLWLVWWNGSYDQGTLRVGSKKVDDLWYMAKIALPKLSEFNLDVVTNHLFPKQNFYGDINKKQMHKANWAAAVLDELQLKYAATDVYVMKLIWDKIYPKVKDNRAYQVDSLNLGYAVRWQQNGLKVKESVRKATELEYQTKLAEVKTKFPVELNVNSFQQVRALLAAYDLGWDVSTPEKWKLALEKHKENPVVKESDETALLTRAAKGCPYSELILEERGIIKTLGFLEGYNRDRVYSHYNPYGARTGRWVSKGGDREEAANLQQLPRKLKKVFGFEEEDDRVFVGADLPTAELRLIAAVYGEHTMAECFRNDIDIHYRTASNTLGKPIDQVTSDERKKAKAENFGLCYGMGADKFQAYAFTNYDIIMTIEEAEARRNSWMAAYPDQARFLDKIKKDFFKGDLVVKTLLNRWVKPDMYTDASNIPIQGGIAEVAKIWIHYLHVLAKEEYGIRKLPIIVDNNNIVYNMPVANFVHDSLTLEAQNKAEADDWKDLLYRSCDKAWDYYMSLPGILIRDIPMPLEVGIGKSYGDAS